MIWKLFIALFSLSLFAAAPKHAKMTATMISIEKKNFLAITLKNDPHWHTYWKNPGDAGLATEFIFSAGENKYSFHQMPWPLPTRFVEEGNMITFGYEGTYTFFFGLSENDIKSLEGKKLKAYGKWLICKDICIPGKDEVYIEFKSGSQTLITDHDFLMPKQDILKAYRALPETKETSQIEYFLSASKEENIVYLHYFIKDLTDLDKNNNILTPFSNELVGFGHEDLFYNSQTKTYMGQVKLDWNGIYQEPEVTLPKNGRFRKPLNLSFLFKRSSQQPAFRINKSFSSFNPSPINLQTIQSGYQPLSSRKEQKKNESGHNDKKDTNALIYLIFALLGGFILNFMPCVLPVISLKLYSLIEHSNESRSNILKHNLFYSLGVISTFVLLAIITLALKSSGQAIGWGFQLQSPHFLLIMLIILWIMTLNLFGLFEFATPGGSKIGNIKTDSGFTGDFLTGVFATILSTPCSAPFLGAALTFAFTTSTINLFLIFILLGIGLSSPFIITAFFPGALKILPRPGKWMQTFKYFLGITMFGTFIWLAYVLANIVDINSIMIPFILIFVSLFAAFYLYNKFNKKLIFFMIPFIASLLFSYLSINNFSESVETIVTSNSKWSPILPKEIDKLKKNNSVSFINFTAKWCLTCQVNKKLVLTSKDFEDYVAKNKIYLFEADWTKYNPEITNFLESFGVYGVPAYFIVKNGEIKYLGESISLSKIKEALK